MATLPYWMLAAQSAGSTTTNRTGRKLEPARPASQGQQWAQANQSYAQMQQNMGQPPQSWGGAPDVLRPVEAPRLPSWMIQTVQPTMPFANPAPGGQGPFASLPFWLFNPTGATAGPAFPGAAGNQMTRVLPTQRAQQPVGVPWHPGYGPAAGTSWGGTPDILRDRLPTIGGNRSTNFEDDRRNSLSDYLRGTSANQSYTQPMSDGSGYGGGGWDWGGWNGGGGGGGYSTAKDVGAWARLVSWNIK